MGLDISVVKPIRASQDLIEKCRIDEEDMPCMYIPISITKNSSLKRFINFAFKKEVEYIDFEETFKSLGLNFSDYRWGMTAEKGYYFMLNSKEAPSMDITDDEDYAGWDLVIGFEMLKTFKEQEDWIIGESIGWQRKGANSLFYTDDENGDSMWSSPPIVEKSVLLEHWKKYFSCSTPTAPGGFGSGVEFEQSDSEMRENFKKNIVDKFIEGETYVIYH